MTVEAEPNFDLIIDWIYMTGMCDRLCEAAERLMALRPVAWDTAGAYRSLDALIAEWRTPP